MAENTGKNFPQRKNMIEYVKVKGQTITNYDLDSKWSFKVKGWKSMQGTVSHRAKNMIE